MELNPNHPVLKELRENWHAVAALLLHKLKQESVEIAQEDLDSFGARGRLAIVADARGEGLILRLVPFEEGQRLARGEGGLPV